MPKAFYVTTPIFYVNDVPHLGHAYAALGADVLARFMRGCGREVVFSTGTDEHGLKVEKASREKGFASPQALVDETAPRYNALWSKLAITHDRFIRTTDADHKAVAAKFWETVAANGFIEKRQYQGWYCVHEETFWPEGQLQQPGNLCPDCGRPTELATEENYFFKQTAFVERLRAHLEAHPDFVAPALRRNEILGSYLNAPDGVHDQSISRSNFTWGIPVPGDPSQVIYVWFDALINYITMAGWGQDDARFAKVWPADVHIIGKDILRFHAVLWPAMLMAAGIELPKKVFGTGLIMNDGVKMSKSLGNAIDPNDWIERFGADTVRYYLLREVPYGQDGSISEAGIVGRYNAELANGLGNLLSRSAALCEKNQVTFTAWVGPQDGDAELLAVAQGLHGRYLVAMENLAFHEALEAVNELVRAANKYTDERAPWTLAKDKSDEGRLRLAHALYCIAEAGRLCLTALVPFMPQVTEKGLANLGYPAGSLFDERGRNQAQPLPQLLAWGVLPAGLSLSKGEPLFPRREAAKA
jgi:methionyl-tRNA synthetase